MHACTCNKYIYVPTLGASPQKMMKAHVSYEANILCEVFDVAILVSFRFLCDSS